MRKKYVIKDIELILKYLKIEYVKEYGFYKENKKYAKPKRFDFAIPNKKIAIEIEGGTWLNKCRHTSGIGYANDCRKYNKAVILGWKVIRFTSDMIQNNEFYETLKNIL